MKLSPFWVYERQPPAGMYRATAPGVMAAGQVVRVPPTVSHWFSFARSPRGGTARPGFWFTCLNPSGAVSPSGGYAPVTPGAASELGDHSGEIGRASCRERV